jgi:hypothetical protein
MQWTWSNGEVCPNLHIPIKLHYDERGICVQGDLLSSLTTLGLQCHFASFTTCQEMMKVAKCMEDDSMHKKASMPQVLQFTMRIIIGNVTKIERGAKKEMG